MNVDNEGVQILHDSMAMLSGDRSSKRAARANAAKHGNLFFEPWEGQAETKSLPGASHENYRWQTTCRIRRDYSMGTIAAYASCFVPTSGNSSCSRPPALWSTTARSVLHEA